MHRSCGIGGIVDAHAEVEGPQGRACDAVDLALQEGAEGGVHGEAACITVSQVHARGDHAHRQLASLLICHRGEFTVDTIVFRRLNREGHTHVFQGLRDGHTAVEEDTPAWSVIIADSCLHLFGGCDIQFRVIGIACELHITAVLDCEGLQRNHR